jgi:hypothetical protein
MLTKRNKKLKKMKKKKKFKKKQLFKLMEMHKLFKSIQAAPIINLKKSKRIL